MCKFGLKIASIRPKIALPLRISLTSVFVWSTDWRVVNVGHRFGGNHGARRHALLRDEKHATATEERTVTHSVG